MLLGLGTCLVVIIVIVLSVVAVQSSGDNTSSPGVKQPYTEDLQSLFVANKPTVSWFHGGKTILMPSGVGNPGLSSDASNSICRFGWKLCRQGQRQ